MFDVQNLIYTERCPKCAPFDNCSHLEKQGQKVVHKNVS